MIQPLRLRSIFVMGASVAALSAAAVRNAARPEFSLEQHVRQFVALAETHIAAVKLSGATA